MSVTKSLVRVRKNPNGTYTVEYRCKFLWFTFWNDNSQHCDFESADLRAKQLVKERSLETVTVREYYNEEV